ncbi:MAG TPA: phosphotransferase [Microthrixaceae bacterium]|nr:phosphotransferase [Microthrixaceae bacterium]
MPDEPLAIADTPEKLTPEWLTDALSRSGHLDGLRVVEAHVHPVGTGQVCDSYRIAMTFNGPTPTPSSLVAKLPGADPTSRATSQMLRHYEKEVGFYRELASTLTMRTPRPYYADVDPGANTFVLLLEDMAPAQQGDQLAGCTPEVAELAVRELVGLHAPRWGDPALHELEWLAGGDVESGMQMATMMLPMLWQGFQERYASVLDHHVLDAGRQLFAHLDGYLTPDEEPVTVIHGDYRLDNLLLDPDPLGVPIATVDWQTCTLGGGARDVGYFVGAGLLEHDRREAEDGLLRMYRDGLVAAGVDHYSDTRAQRDYRMGAWTGLMIAIGASMMVERTDRGDEMFMVMASRHSRHALDLDAVEVLR